MFSTSSLYFLVAIFGESIENNQSHISQLAERQMENVSQSGQNENQELLEIHNGTGETSEQGIQQEQTLEHNITGSNQIEQSEKNEMPHQDVFEKQRRVLEFPLSIGAGIGYAATGLWMILDRRNSKSPHIVAIVGSLILLGIYASSRTIGISNLGTESVGMFDAIVAGLQVAIIATCLYILVTRINPNGITIDK